MAAGGRRQDLLSLCHPCFASLFQTPEKPHFHPLTRFTRQVCFGDDRLEDPFRNCLAVARTRFPAEPLLLLHLLSALCEGPRSTGSVLRYLVRYTDTWGAADTGECGSPVASILRLCPPAVLCAVGGGRATLD